MCKISPQVKCCFYLMVPLRVFRCNWTQDDVRFVGLVVNSDEIGPLFGGRDISHRLLNERSQPNIYEGRQLTPTGPLKEGFTIYMKCPTSHLVKVLLADLAT